MNCNDFEQWLDDYLDRELETGQLAAMEAHRQDCDHCQRLVDDEQGLRAALRRLPVPEPSAAFFEQALLQVTQHRRRMRNSGRIGLALAAGVVLSISVNALFDTSEHSPAGDHPAVMQIALNEKRDVKLVFDTPTELDAAHLTLRLPTQVRIAGYPNRQELSWVTHLKQGKNLLVLPVSAQQSGHGKLVAEIEHDGDTKTFAIDLDVTGQQQSIRTLTAAQTV